MDEHVVYFGAVEMLRGICPICGGSSLIVDGRYLCCGISLKDCDLKETKRECRTFYKRKRIPARVKRSILDDQEGKCFWCVKKLEGTFYYDPKRKTVCSLKTHYDHVIAWVYSGDDRESNLVASCNLCNLYKNDRIFRTIEACKSYIKEKINQRGIEFYEDGPRHNKGIKIKRCF